MSLSAAQPVSVVSPWYARAEWGLVVGLAAVFVWTTLCLGGYMAHTLVATSWSLAGLAALGGILLWWRPQPLHRAMWLPLPFLAYALWSVFALAPARWLAWREWLLWFQMWLVFALVLHFGRSRRQLWVWVVTFAGLGAVGVAMAAYQRYVDQTWMMLGRSQADQFYGRSAGMFGIPNSLAGLLELMVPVLLAILFSRSVALTGKILCSWLAALFLFAIVLTGSRGGWIGLGGALLVWPLIAGRAWKRKLAGAAAVLALAVIAVGALYRFSEPARERIQPFLEGKFEATRPLIWKAGWQIWREHPWLGSGTASYNVVFEQHRPARFNNEPDWTHNDYLNTLSDYGVVGFVCWAGAGAWLLALGWGAVRRARREGNAAGDAFAGSRWRLGLWLGLLAYSLHLAVDFHTKIPALAFAAAIVLAVLIRDEPKLRGAARVVGGSRSLGVFFVVVPLGLVAALAAPLYEAEGIRFIARRDIDRYAARNIGNPKQLIPAGLAAFERAVAIYPAHGQAWADLSYALVQSWHVRPGQSLKALGGRAEQAADRALVLCSIQAEYWVRKAVALDMQAKRSEAETCFRRAIALAPNSRAWHYYYAYHLSVRAGREADALRSVETCLALDPGFSAGVALHQQLTTRR